MNEFMQKYNIHETWLPLFEEVNKSECIENKIEEIYFTDETIYPKKEFVFRVFCLPVNKIQLVLLGQDPYHNDGQADGLSFSVPNNVKIPPSLKNIFLEIEREFPERNYKLLYGVNKTGNLDRWLKEEYIFLLNSSLTFVKNNPASHMHIWQNFTTKVIEFISKKNEKCVFLLLGKYATGKIQYIQNKERVIFGVHPSPLSAKKGFFNSGVFHKVEELLNKEINWSVK